MISVLSRLLHDPHAGDDPPPGLIGWAGVALLFCVSALSALFELLFLAQFYIGTVIVPVTVVVALVVNVLVPAWGYRTVHTMRGAVIPIVGWLLMLLGLSMYTRPEGDLFVIGEQGQQYAFYALLIVGAVAGFATAILLSGNAQVATRPTSTRPTSTRPTSTGPTAERPTPNRRPKPGATSTRRPNR